MENLNRRKLGQVIASLALGLFLMLPGNSYADNSEEFDITPDEAVRQLDASGTVYQASLNAVRKYAKDRGLIEKPESRKITPLPNGDPQCKTLDLLFMPKVLPTGNAWSYPVIRVTIYFYAPGHFQRTFGKNTVDFYRVETLVHVVKRGSPSPGFSTSGGG